MLSTCNRNRYSQTPKMTCPICEIPKIRVFGALTKKDARKKNCGQGIYFLGVRVKLFCGVVRGWAFRMIQNLR